ncbi:MAG: sn-glycerol-3-phosphate ABC transporter ATP-binding protein UgpC [Alphaproteobacteria bacterium]|nr:sn-glycerol-3-phosphate ABC transporter ATP-binding protein UgpC [Alphaproteobacteria bacterium]
MADVKISKLTKTFGSVQVLHGLDIDIKDGEFVALVGPSGCGKSTLLRMVAGLEDVTSGDISIDQKVVNLIPPKKRDIAMVFQNYALYPHLTVAQNMGFSLRLSGVPKDETTRQVRESAEILGLVPLLDRKPGQLSGGQRQRVAMGRAIVRRPKVFLFDEPLSNLDAKLRVKVRGEIKELHERLGTTTIYVTHDQIEAMTMADRIVIMRDGHIEQIGTPGDLYSRPSSTFVAGFIGSPPMNLIPGTVAGNAFTCSAGTVSLAGTLADGAADGPSTFGVRPESLEVVKSTNGRPNALTIKVRLVEPTGPEDLLVADLGDGDVFASVRGRHDISAGDVVQLFVPPEAVHLFDPETGLRSGA